MATATIEAIHGPAAAAASAANTREPSVLPRANPIPLSWPSAAAWLAPPNSAFASSWIPTRPAANTSAPCQV